MNAAVRLDRTAIAILSEMAMDGAPDLVPTVIAIFLDTTPAILDTLEQSARSGDLRALQRASHDLKSSSATLGARLMSVRCARLEAIGRSGLASETKEAVAGIIAEFHAVRPMLAALLTPETERALTADPV